MCIGQPCQPRHSVFGGHARPTPAIATALHGKTGFWSLLCFSWQEQCQAQAYHDVKGHALAARPH